jgi:hypothetical protein
MKKREAELLEEIKKFIEGGGSYDEAVAACLGRLHTSALSLLRPHVTPFAVRD